MADAVKDVLSGEDRYQTLEDKQDSFKTDRALSHAPKNAPVCRHMRHPACSLHVPTPSRLVDCCTRESNSQVMKVSRQTTLSQLDKLHRGDLFHLRNAAAMADIPKFSRACAGCYRQV